MSDNSSNTENTRSAAEIRQDITDYVLKHVDEMSDVPGVKEFVEEHGRLTTEITEAEDRLQRLEKAKTEYEPLENRVTTCRKALKDGEAELAEMHRPLGTAAFQSFLDGDIEDQPLFADRLAAHKKIQELQRERDDLAPSADAGMAQKAKAKAQQLAVTGKIKYEEMKFGGLEAEIGRKAVEDKLDESVRCDSTNEHLGKIAELRKGIANSTDMVNDSEAAQEEAAKKLCKSVPMERIEGTDSLDTEITKCSKHVRASEASSDNSNRVLIAALHDVEQSTLQDPLIDLVQNFSKQNVNEKLPFGEWYRRKFFKVISQPNPQSGFYQYLLWGTPFVFVVLGWYLIDGTAEEPDDPRYLELVRYHQQKGFVERLAEWWNSMSRRGKIITGAVTAVMFLVVISGDARQKARDDDQKAEHAVAQRDLSTPESRLVGHWGTSAGDNAYYSKIGDDEIGQYTLELPTGSLAYHKYKINSQIDDNVTVQFLFSNGDQRIDTLNLAKDGKKLSHTTTAVGITVTTDSFYVDSKVPPPYQEIADSAADSATLTPSYLPHKEGVELRYANTTLGIVFVDRHVFKANGSMIKIAEMVGPMKADPNTFTPKKYLRRESKEFVDLVRLASKDEPWDDIELRLKKGAKPGDEWSLKQGPAMSTWTLKRFDISSQKTIAIVEKKTQIGIGESESKITKLLWLLDGVGILESQTRLDGMDGLTSHVRLVE
jgi:hypothetical protein